MRQSLPGINAIGCLPCEVLPSHIEERELCGIPVQIQRNATAVPFVGVPTCITESDYDNNGRSEVTTLTFMTTEKVAARRRMAFVVHQNNGSVYLIGHLEQPFPTVKVSRHSGVPDSDRAVYTVEVKLIGRRTLVPSDVYIGDL